MQDLVEALTKAFTGDSRNRHAKRNGSPNIGPKRARDVAYRIVCGLMGATKASLPINYRTIGVNGNINHQLVKEFFEWMEASRLIEDLLALLPADQKRKFNALVLTSAVQRIAGPNRPFAVHLHMPSEVQQLATDQQTPAGLRALIRKANTGSSSKAGAAASAIGLLASSEGVNVVLDEPFAFEGWFRLASYGPWSDEPSLETAIRAAARLDESTPLPDSMAAIARMAVSSLRRLERHGFELWLESGRITHGFKTGPDHSHPEGLLPDHPLPGEHVSFLGADLDALAIAMEHERVVLDLPDPFSSLDFDDMPLAFEVEKDDGEAISLSARELREDLMAEPDTPSTPAVPWRSLSEMDNAKYTGADPLWPPDIAYLHCTLTSSESTARVPATLLLYTNAIDRGTSMFVTKALPASATPANNAHLRAAIGQIQRHLDRYGRDLPLDAELRAHAPVKAAPLRSVPAHRNLASLTSVARAVSAGQT